MFNIHFDLFMIFVILTLFVKVMRGAEELNDHFRRLFLREKVFHVQTVEDFSTYKR